MVTGQAAFQGDHLGQLLGAITHGAPLPASQVRPGLPASIELVIARAMQKNQRSRYQDAAEMARDLAQCRASLVRGRASTANAVTVTGVDVYTATDPGSRAGKGAEAEAGLPLASGFDSSAGLRRLQQGGAPPPARDLSWGRTAWTCGYLLAAGAALLIAFG
jgi:serine/threonine-protein kinase